MKFDIHLIEIFVLRSFTFKSKNVLDYEDFDDSLVKNWVKREKPNMSETRTNYF